MASKIEFVEYMADQMRDAGTITYKKMFGEYGLYCNGKIFAVICDNRLFIKMTEAGRKVCPELQEAPPYEGAKNYFLVEDVENREPPQNSSKVPLPVPAYSLADKTPYILFYNQMPCSTPSCAFSVSAPAIPYKLP